MKNEKKMTDDNLLMMRGLRTICAPLVKSKVRATQSPIRGVSRSLGARVSSEAGVRTQRLGCRFLAQHSQGQFLGVHGPTLVEMTATRIRSQVLTARLGVRDAPTSDSLGLRHDVRAIPVEMAPIWVRCAVLAGSRAVLLDMATHGDDDLHVGALRIPCGRGRNVLNNSETYRHGLDRHGLGIHRALRRARWHRRCVVMIVNLLVL